MDYEGMTMGLPELSSAGGKPFHVTPPAGIGKNVFRWKSAANIPPSQHRVSKHIRHNKLTSLEHLVPPPVHIDRPASRELQREEDHHDGNYRPAVQRRAQHIVELAPPRKIALANEILERKSDREPRRVVDTRRRWYR